MPYRSIEHVYVEYFEPPQWMMRMPGTSRAPLYIYEGNFKYANEWYFLSFGQKMPLLHIELNGNEKYKYVIFEIGNTRELLIKVRKRLRETQAPYI